MTRIGASLIALFLITACGDNRLEDQETLPKLSLCGHTCGGDQFLMDDLAFVTPNDDGELAGWNLDGLVSDETDASGCRKPDFNSPDGETGIDNQIAPLVEEIVSFAGEAFPELIKNAVREGGLAYLFEVVEKNGEHGLVVRRTSGKPLLGTDDNILPGQTLPLHREYWLGGTKALRWENNRLSGGPFRLRLPAEVFGIEYQITLVDAHIDFEFGNRFTDMTGYVGGSFHVDDVHRIADTIVVDELGDLVRVLVPPFADIRSEVSGQCDRISAGVKIHGVRAFSFPVSRSSTRHRH